MLQISPRRRRGMGGWADSEAPVLFHCWPMAVYQAQTHGSCDSPFGEVCYGMMLVRLRFML